MIKEILVLPIYGKSREQYYKKAGAEFEKIKKRYEENWTRVGAKFPEKQVMRLRCEKYAPPWRFNSIIGYVLISWDKGRYIHGSISLKLKCMPKDHDFIHGSISLKLKCMPKDHDLRGFKPSKYSTTLENQQIFHYGKTDRVYIEDIGNNASIIEAVQTTLRNAKAEIRKVNKKWQMGSLPFDVKYIDFVNVLTNLAGSDVPVPK